MIKICLPLNEEAYCMQIAQSINKSCAHRAQQCQYAMHDHNMILNLHKTRDQCNVKYLKHKFIF